MYLTTRRSVRVLKVLIVFVLAVLAVLVLRNGTKLHKIKMFSIIPLLAMARSRVSGGGVREWENPKNT